MQLKMDKRVRTTHAAMHAEIAASSETSRALGHHFGTGGQTLYKRRRRAFFHERSGTARLLQTALTPAQKVVVALHWTLLLPPDDLLAVTRDFTSGVVSHPGLDCSLSRHGLSNLRVPLHSEDEWFYRFVVIDRASRWVFVQTDVTKLAVNARARLSAPRVARPIRITCVLTDSRQVFTGRLFASHERESSGGQVFDQVCQEPSIEHQTTRPRGNAVLNRGVRTADVLRTCRLDGQHDFDATSPQCLSPHKHLICRSRSRKRDAAAGDEEIV